MAVDTIARALAIKAQQGGGSGGTSNYQELTNKPSINGVTLEGDKTSSDLGINIGDFPTYYVTNNSKDNPLILEDINPGWYIFSNILGTSGVAYIKGANTNSEVLSVSISRSNQPLLYFKKYSDAEDGEDIIFGMQEITFFYSETNNTLSIIKKLSSQSGISASTGVPAYASNILKRTSNSTISGRFTFSTLPSTSILPSSEEDMVNKKYVDDLVSTISTLSFQVVTELPTTDIQTNIIYLVPSTTSSEQNVYDEYIYINSTWEKIGSTAIDLSNYLAKDNTTAYTPTGDYNPATKQYVDSSVTNQATTEETISGLKTFTTLPESSVVPTTNNQLVNKAYVDSTLSTTLGNINTILATLTTVSEVTE